jgi:HlyD family secretion protein
LAIRAEIEQQRYANSQRELEAQMASQQARLEQLRAQYNLQRTRSEALKIRASTDGILQELAINAQSLQIGQQVPAGTTLARVADPRRLKAEIRIAETQAKDVAIGQKASIDTRNGVIPGRVVRMDPGSTGGTVTGDVALEGDLPPGARPELSVEGVVDLENLENILYVGRPAFGQERSTVSMFRLGPDGVTAERVQVKLGRTSVNLVEIMEGLKEGDQVVLSDMSRWDSFDRIRLE